MVFWQCWLFFFVPTIITLTGAIEDRNGGEGRGDFDAARISQAKNVGTRNVTSSTTASSNNTTISSLPPPPALACNVYLAPSTLGSDANLGIFTAVALNADQVVSHPDIAIPLLFREPRQRRPKFTKDGRLWDRYIWEGSKANLDPYDDTNREASRAVFLPGLGSAINSALDMHNVKIAAMHGVNDDDDGGDGGGGSTTTYYDTVGIHRATHPGAGAFSPYHNVQTVTTRNIPAGSELFDSYGSNWIPNIPGVQVTQTPFMDAADDFMYDDYLPFVEQHQDSNLTMEMREALWEFTTTSLPMTSRAFSNLPQHASWVDVETFLQSHQKDSTKLNDGQDEGQNLSLVRHFHQRQSIRSLAWLQQHGVCQDHLRAGPSTLSQGAAAGRGAFATRPLPADTVVAYAPLIHLGVDGLRLWEIPYENNAGDHGTARKAFDLILNYSFGHPRSSVLLTPYGAMVNLINHHHTKPNVRIQWPQQTGLGHDPDWLLRHPTVLRDTQQSVGLAFEYVAMRDIAEGEEIFMDYGAEWEEAWKAYVQNWRPLDKAQFYLHRSDLPPEPYFRTFMELQRQPYPHNIHTMCIPTYSRNERGRLQWIPTLREGPQRVHCEVVRRYTEKAHIVGPVHTTFSEQKDEYLYDVDMQLNTQDVTNFTRVLGVPKEGISLCDKAFTQDWQLPTAFRYPIAIPDEIMPEAWKNE